MSDPIVLRLPTLDEEAEVMRAYQAARAESPHFLHFHEDAMPFARYLDVLMDRERGVNIPPAETASTFRFAFVGARVVGRVSIRHGLSPWHERFGGHIGYVVVPEFRRRGYATEILRQAVRIARDRLGLPRVLVTCDDDNLGSIRTIEKNGGVFESVVSGDGVLKPKRRYWLTAP